MRRRDFLTAAALAALTGCAAGGPRPATSTGPRPDATRSPEPAVAARRAESPGPGPSASPSPDAGQILARSTVPVLCFHQLREFRSGDSATAKRIITPPAIFEEQLRALRDGGYSPVEGSQVVDHVERGTRLPERPVLLTFDDGSRTHHSVALPVLERFGFPGVFFPMAIVLDKPNWLTRVHLRDLDRAGHTIGAHSYSHQRMDRLSGEQWHAEVADPRRVLSDAIGRPVDLLAYPFGAWSPEVLPHVRDAGYRAAFQLDQPQDRRQPMLTLRRIMPPPTWGATTLVAELERQF